MKHISLLVSISAFLFQIVQSTNSSFDGLVSSDSSLSKYYEKSAKDLVSGRLSGTKFCESILLPTAHTLRKSLQATLFSARHDTYLDDKGRLDSCCRSLHKCDAYTNIDLNDKILHCECVHSFRICLKQLDTSLSSDLALIHSINTTKCYAKDHPIIKCVKLEAYVGSASQYLKYMDSTLSDTFFYRCAKYELDESQPQKLQLFDLPFIVPVNGQDDGNNLTEANLTEAPKLTSKTMKNKDELIAAMLDIFKMIECKKLSQINDEQRSGRHIVGSIVTDSLNFLKQMLELYCSNMQMREKVEEVPSPSGNIFNNTIYFHNTTIINNYWQKKP